VLGLRNNKNDSERKKFMTLFSEGGLSFGRIKLLFLRSSEQRSALLELLQVSTKRFRTSKASRTPHSKIRSRAAAARQVVGDPIKVVATMKRLAQSLSFKSPKSDRPASAAARTPTTALQAASLPTYSLSSPPRADSGMLPASAGRDRTGGPPQSQGKLPDAFARQHEHGAQCAVCQQPFASFGARMPKLAPCLHTLCNECLQGGGDCPMDGTPVLPDKVAPTNWIVLGCTEIARMQQGKTRHCDLCDEESADSVSSHQCSHCNLHLCELHATAHQRSRETKPHVLRPFSIYVAGLQKEHPSGLRVARNLKPLMCQEPGHHDQKVEVWCAVCETANCVKCALLRHREHATGVPAALSQRTLVHSATD